MKEIDKEKEKVKGKGKEKEKAKGKAKRKNFEAEICARKGRGSAAAIRSRGILETTGCTRAKYYDKSGLTVLGEGAYIQYSI